MKIHQILDDLFECISLVRIPLVRVKITAKAYRMPASMGETNEPLQPIILSQMVG